MPAFQFRMGASFPGEVNRSHPASIEPALSDPTSPPTFYGEALIYTGAPDNAVRTTAIGDAGLTHIDGVLVRPFPIQQASATNFGAVAIGSAPAVPGGNAVDVVKSGYVMVPVVGTPAKGGAVWVWVDVTGGGHTHGGFEAVSGGGSTIAIETDGRTYFNGPPDASGVCELAFNV